MGVTLEDIVTLGNNQPIVLADMSFGLIIRFNRNDSEFKPNHIGVQVPKEEDIRWIPVENIVKFKSDMSEAWMEKRV